MHAAESAREVERYDEVEMANANIVEMTRLATYD